MGRRTRLSRARRPSRAGRLPTSSKFSFSFPFSDGDIGREEAGADVPASDFPPARLPAPDFHDTDEESLAVFVMRILRQANRPLGMDELLRISKLPRRTKKSLETTLFALAREGRILRVSGGWSSSSGLRRMEGKLSVRRSGVGFVAPLGGKGGPDVYIHPAAINGAWHGDQVEVVILPGKRGPSLEGKILRVLSRATAELAVRALHRQKEGEWLCAPVAQSSQALFLTDVWDLSEVKENDLLLIRPQEQLGARLWRALGLVNMEREKSPLAQERLVKSLYAVPGEFSAAAQEETRQLPLDPGGEDLAGRRDLRHLCLVTIDGRNARDFDDAVHVEALPSGFRLRVAVADVSHYVREGFALDTEARLRGVSRYFPLSVEPMLPEELSNGLCSLKEGVPRLAMVADLEFSSSGRRLRSEFYPALIMSKARLTYGQVERGLLLHEPEEEKSLAPVLPMLQEAERLARLLVELRKERGRLDFSLPEAEVIFNEQGEISDLVPRRRHFGHRMIEEFMVAANEAVAEFLEERGQNFLYRVHEPPDPDKFGELLAFWERSGFGAESWFQEFLRESEKTPGKGFHGRKFAQTTKAASMRKYAHSLARAGERESSRGSKRNQVKKGQAQALARGKGRFRSRLSPRDLSRLSFAPSARDLGRLLDGVRGSAHEYIVNRLLLRSMMQARYRPEKGGHYGLGSEAYCHFTSPIRRYADLITHRALKASLGYGERKASSALLTPFAEHINDMEHTAAEVEREIIKRFGLLFLRGKMDEIFEGVISGLSNFGIFVELFSGLVDATLPLADLRDDYYLYIPEYGEVRGTRFRRCFRLGETLFVRLKNINFDRLEIELSLAGKREDGGARHMAEKKRTRS